MHHIELAVAIVGDVIERLAEAHGFVILHLGLMHDIEGVA